MNTTLTVFKAIVLLVVSVFVINYLRALTTRTEFEAMEKAIIVGQLLADTQPAVDEFEAE